MSLECQKIFLWMVTRLLLFLRLMAYTSLPAAASLGSRNWPTMLVAPVIIMRWGEEDSDIDSTGNQHGNVNNTLFATRGERGIYSRPRPSRRPALRMP